jgi:CubicO group peptidase (beta-lactamase class C family)/dienelactone hydrolase/TPR repeat protein
MARNCTYALVLFVGALRLLAWRGGGLTLLTAIGLSPVVCAVAQPAVSQVPPRAPVDRPLHGIPIPDWARTYKVAITHDIPIRTRGPAANGSAEQTITAMLFRPDRAGPMPGAVILNSSGGVDGESELVWAGYLAELGIATLVVDSFTARGIRRTSRDQSLFDGYWSIGDGAAGWRWLAAQAFIQRDRILVSGLSRGAGNALALALETRRKQTDSTGARFAAHVAISPNCNVQERDARTTGAPILFLLGELDDYTPIKPCVDYVDRLRAAGNADVRLAVYAGGFHGPEAAWGTAAQPDVETWKKCLFMRNADGKSMDELVSGVTIPVQEFLAYSRKHCNDPPGGSIGGDMRLRRQMGADLLRFLMQYGFIADPDMQAALPDCGRLPETGGVRRSCQRAGWGWNAEAARLAPILARGEMGVTADPPRAVSLLDLAAKRGEPAAQALLAAWMREGWFGLPRDLARARALAALAAAQGYGGGVVEVGLLAEQAGDALAARAAFRRAAERYNRFGMAHYGRVMANGIGGAAEPAEAERWLKLAVHYENPWGAVFLARALETGKLGRPADPRAALDAYRTAAAQSFAGQAEAQRAVARLEAAAAKPTYDRLGPDAAALGANEGYPAARTRDADSEKRHWVAAFSGRDALYPHHVIQRAASPSPLARASSPLTIDYQYEGARLGLKDYLSRNPVTGLIVAQGETIGFEHYQYGRNERHRFDSQSMAKTVTAILVGIAVAEGRIASIDDRAEKYVAELKGTAYGAATIRDLLQMSSGVRYTEVNDGKDDHARFTNETVRQNGPGGAAALKRYTEYASPPGTRFSYAGAETFTLSLVLRAATGVPMATYLQTRIWQPMGAEADATWFIDKSGQEQGYCCLNAVLRDYARFALMLAHDGAWNGRQIVPSEWVKAATTADRKHLQPGQATRSSGYGYQVWILSGSRRLFALIGSYGQLALVDPATRSVMVQTALPPRENPRATEPFVIFRALVGAPP